MKTITVTTLQRQWLINIIGGIDGANAKIICQAVKLLDALDFSEADKTAMNYREVVAGERLLIAWDEEYNIHEWKIEIKDNLYTLLRDNLIDYRWPAGVLTPTTRNQIPALYEVFGVSEEA